MAKLEQQAADRGRLAAELRITPVWLQRLLMYPFPGRLRCSTSTRFFWSARAGET
jgi:hypothetical protein